MALETMVRAGEVTAATIATTSVKSLPHRLNGSVLPERESVAWVQSAKTSCETHAVCALSVGVPRCNGKEARPLVGARPSIRVVALKQRNLNSPLVFAKQAGNDRSKKERNHEGHEEPEGGYSCSGRKSAQRQVPILLESEGARLDQGWHPANRSR
jgi:hypothetical protein